MKDRRLDPFLKQMFSDLFSNVFGIILAGLYVLCSIPDVAVQGHNKTKMNPLFFQIAVF